jgi:hypothetical protein
VSPAAAPSIGVTVSSTVFPVDQFQPPKNETVSRSS